MSSHKDKSASQEDHSGHRKRKKQALLENGASKLTDTDLLEMLLYYAVARVDTRKTAEELLEKFGTLSGVMSAGIDELTKFPGLKEGAEVLFSLLKELLNRAGKPEDQKDLLEPEKLKKYLINLFKGLDAETVYALYFSKEGVLVGKQIVFKGGISAVRFSLRTVTEGAINAGGALVVLAHNHPSGVLVPSNDDVLSTRRIASHLNANEIQLIEHYIVGEKDCVGILNLEE